MTTTKSYDFLNRLSSIYSAPSADSALSYSYSYNDANQRTRVNLADGSFWIYEYDKLGQVISGKRYWSDWTPVAGQQYEYAFDDIGNRTSTKAGGDAVGAGLRPATYSANALNQYTSRDVPGAADVIGAAHPVASVTVNSQSPYRRGEYYRAELNPDNSVNPVWQSVTNIAWLAGVSETNTGNLFLPKTAETYTYDADGNLTSDGRWTNKWDGENRLIEMTSHASGPSGSRKSLQFGYDSQSRRVSKVVSNWTGSAWTRALDEKFLYDGWNLLGVLNGTNNAILKSFLWGLDLSGSLQGAGGVGGLIAFSNRQSPVGTHFVAYDANGNVIAIVDGSTAAVSARYEYDSFGQTIRATGLAASLNPMRFSCKHADDETDLAYYGYRYLSRSTGQWLTRDPLGEIGHETLKGVTKRPIEAIDANLCAFVNNDPIGKVDLLGETIADLATKIRGGQIPKEIGVQAGGLLAVRIPFVARTIGLGSAVGVYFFPDSCEVGAYSLRAGLGSETGIQWYELGVIGTLGGSFEAATYINNPSPGAANADSFVGVFHTAEVSTPAWSAGAYVGDPDSAGGRWIGAQIGIGPGLGGMLIAWNYQFIFGQSKVTIPRCLCYAAITAM
jgi:RHS repeat-associated protein